MSLGFQENMLNASNCPDYDMPPLPCDQELFASKCGLPKRILTSELVMGQLPKIVFAKQQINGTSH